MTRGLAGRTNGPTAKSRAKKEPSGFLPVSNSPITRVQLAAALGSLCFHKGIRLFVMASQGNANKSALTIHLCKPLRSTLEEMYVESRSSESKLTLSDFASQLLEGLIADHRALRVTAQRKPYERPHHF